MVHAIEAVPDLCMQVNLNVLCATCMMFVNLEGIDWCQAIPFIFLPVFRPYQPRDLHFSS